MPTYDYRCEDCGAVTESTRPMSQRNETPPCPECGSETHLVLLSAPVVPWFPGSTRIYKEKGKP